MKLARVNHKQTSG